MSEHLRAYVDRTMIQDGMGTPIRFVAATEGIKRDGLNLKMMGARLDNYRRNPVMLWCHDYYSRPPIGRVDMTVEGDRLMADVSFDQSDPYAVDIERKYRSGYLHAVSIGWNTLVLNGRDVEEWEVLDLSAVPVPGDPLALKERGQRAIKELTSELESLLDEAQAPTEPESEWEQAARRMARVFVEPMADEAARKAEWASAGKQYRKLGKVAPEWMAGDTLRALEIEDIRGLFLEDEAELCADLFVSKRVGAVLSKSNLNDLQQAADLIMGVMARAKKEETAAVEDGERGGMDMTMNDDEMRGVETEAVDVTPLYQIRASLTKVMK